MSGNLEVQPEVALIALTKEMLATAEAKDWERLAALEKIRQPIFYEVFSEVSKSNASLAREVLSIDEKVMNMAELAKPQIQQELQALKNSGMVKNAYQSVQKILSD